MFNTSRCNNSDLDPCATGDAKRALRAIGIVRTFRRNQHIFECQHRCDWWYRIVSGAARKYQVQAHGRRQIVDVYLSSDFFGFSSTEEHKFSVQSIVEGTTVVCYPRTMMEALADSDPSVARLIRVGTCTAIERLEQQMLFVRTTSAAERVREFLLHFRDRLGQFGESDLVLPITRYDIADLLGLSPETVSRAFTDLRERGAISLCGPRHIAITRKGGGTD
jgi:CRP/FNR family nitrogen fixation transcriptional regulator